MKLTRLAFCAALATSLMGSFADAQVRNVRATSHRPTGYSNYYAQSPSDVVQADEGAPAPIVKGETQAAKVDPSMSYIAPAACSSSCDIGTGASPATMLAMPLATIHGSCSSAQCWASTSVVGPKWPTTPATTLAPAS